MKVITDLTTSSRPPLLGLRFTPTALFSGGEQGGWYQPGKGVTRFQDIAAKIPALAPGQTVAALTDLSGNANTAIQATAAARPMVARIPQGGRRNVLIRTEEFQDTAWSKDGVTATDLGNATWLLTENATTGRHRLFNTTGISLGPSSRSIEVRPMGCSRVALRDNNLTGPSFLLDANGSVLSGSGQIAAISNGWFRLTASSGAAQLNQRLLLDMLDETGNAIYTGDGVSAIEVRYPQLEAGIVSSPYQRVGVDADVTEGGKRDLWHLYNDQVDDTLVADFSDLGTQATIASATEGGVSIVAAQTIGAGAFDVLIGARTYALVVIDRALSPAETALLTRYLEWRLP